MKVGHFWVNCCCICVFLGLVGVGEGSWFWTIVFWGDITCSLQLHLHLPVTFKLTLFHPLLKLNNYTLDFHPLMTRSVTVFVI